jgi:hypothetical protein
VSLENLDFLKSTLLKIDEINDKITNKEDIKNGKTMVEMDDKPLEVSLLHTLNERDIMVLLEINEWNHNAKGIDALRVELIKNTEYNSLIQLKHFDLKGEARYLGIKTYGSKTKTDIAVEIVEKKYDNTKNCDLYKHKNLSELKKMMTLKGLNESGTKRDLISRKIVSENEEKVNFNFNGNIDYKYNEKEVTEDFEQLQAEIKKIEEGYLSEKLNGKGRIDKSQIKIKKLSKESFGNKSPKTFFFDLEIESRRKINDERSKTSGGYLVSILVAIFMILIGLSIVSAAITAFAIIIIYGVKNSNKNNDLEISEHVKIKDLKEDLKEEIEGYNKLKKSINSQKRNLDIELKNINKQLNELRNKLLMLKPIIHGFKFRKEYDKQRIQREKDIEMENKKIKDSISILQSEIDNLNSEKSALWNEIKHMIPYSNLI